LKTVKKLIFLSIILVVVVLGVFYFVKNSNTDNQNIGGDVQELKDNINVLILGVDYIPNTSSQRTDTIMLLSYNSKTKKGFLISIPRDTRVDLGRYGINKINAAYAYGGTKLALKEVSDILGLPVKYYIKVDYKGFVKLVDDLGGVDIYVPMDMKYSDPTENLYIDLKKGNQHLNGEQALQLVRFRKGYYNQDLGRIEMQQKFIQAMLDKLKSPSTIFKINKIAETVSEYVETNLPISKMVWYLDDVYNLNKDNIKMSILPGEAKMIGDVSYYIVDEAKSKEMVNELIAFISENSKKNSNSDAAIPVLANLDNVNKNLKIKVLNGGGITGSAAKVSSLLKEKGFNVIKIGNISDFNNIKTYIINKTGDKQIGAYFSRMFEGSVVIEDNAGNDKDADVIIILGKELNYNIQ